MPRECPECGEEDCAECESCGEPGCICSCNDEPAEQGEDDGPLSLVQQQREARRLK